MQQREREPIQFTAESRSTSERKINFLFNLKTPVMFILNLAKNLIFQRLQVVVLQNYFKFILKLQKLHQLYQMYHVIFLLKTILEKCHKVIDSLFDNLLEYRLK